MVMWILSKCVHMAGVGLVRWPRRKGICGEQKTEIVGKKRTGSWKSRKYRQAQQCREPDQHNSQTFAPRQLCENPLNARETGRAKPGKKVPTIQRQPR